MPYTDDVTEVKCPRCGGRMWDNRASKKNPKAPDYKCRDNQCLDPKSGMVTAIWEKDVAGPRMPQPAVKPLTTQGKQPYESGGPLPYEQSETGAPPTANKAEGFQRLFNAYDVCMGHALTVAQKMNKADVGSSPEAVAAIAATLLIQADRQGLTR
jgi:hypothetical protein